MPLVQKTVKVPLAQRFVYADGHGIGQVQTAGRPDHRQADTGGFVLDQQLLREALEKLPEREKKIVVLRFGLAGRREKTQKEVADLMGISQSYISRLEKRIIARLKKELVRMM